NGLAVWKTALTASKTATWTIAMLRAASGGVVPLTRMAFRSAWFQRMTTSAEPVGAATGAAAPIGVFDGRERSSRHSTARRRGAGRGAGGRRATRNHLRSKASMAYSSSPGPADRGASATASDPRVYRGGTAATRVRD